MMTITIPMLILIEGLVSGFTVDNPREWRRRRPRLLPQRPFTRIPTDNSNTNIVCRRAQESWIKASLSAHEINGAQSNSLLGLSKRHQSLVSTTYERQICVTGQYPLHISIQDNPTRKWIYSSMNKDPTVSSSSRLLPSTLQMMVNGTSIDRSLASYDRFQWLDDDERASLHENHALVSIEFQAEIDIRKPGFLHMLPSSAAGSSAAAAQRRGNHIKGTKRGNPTIIQGKERLWITGFSMTQSSGEIHYIDIHNANVGKLNARTRASIQWPNEVALVPRVRHNSTCIDPKSCGYEDALLISDGYLVPGKDQGGIYVVSRPGHGTEWKICVCGGQGMEGLLSKLENRDSVGSWFYHKAVWVDLTNDGRLSILTARCSRGPNTTTDVSKEAASSSSFSSFRSQLVFLERPKPYKYDRETGTPLDIDGTVFDPFSARHTPWKTHVLDEGPDVMFSIADLDTTDDTIEVIASQFFNRRLTLHSIQKGQNPKVTFRRIIDDECGSPFCTVLADLDMVEYPNRRIVDSGSSIPTFKNGDSFSHVLVTNHESASHRDGKNRATGNEKFREEGKATVNESLMNGGSLFSYHVPHGKDKWKTKEWKRSVITTGIYVSDQILNMWNPGSPGLCYAFYPRREEAECKEMRISRPLIGIAGDCANKAIILRPSRTHQVQGDPSSSYSIMCEIDIGGTVGSLAVGYDDLPNASPDSKGYAKLYIPSYEKDKVLVFSMGRGEYE